VGSIIHSADNLGAGGTGVLRNAGQVGKQHLHTSPVILARLHSHPGFAYRANGMDDALSLLNVSLGGWVLLCHRRNVQRSVDRSMPTAVIPCTHTLLADHSHEQDLNAVDDGCKLLDLARVEARVTKLKPRHGGRRADGLGNGQNIVNGCHHDLQAPQNAVKTRLKHD